MTATRILSLVFLGATAAVSATVPDERAAFAVLASEAGVQEKARACQQLAVVGGAGAVPALAALLDDEQLAAHARWGLETIADPAAGEALRAALPKLDGRLLAGVVTSLGVRRDAASAPALCKLVADRDRGAAGPALAALGQIATAEALETIRGVLVDGPAELRVSAAHAALEAAARLTGDGKAEAAGPLLEAVRGADVPAHVKAAATPPARQ